MTIATVKNYLLTLQNKICTMLENEEATLKFSEDVWQHTEGGGGITRLLADGNVIEKAGVNFSHVQGVTLPPTATAKRPQLASGIFEAMGVSVVVHPRNPYAPTSHMNVRYIAVHKPNQPSLWWFGGGLDLTPYYGFTEDCQHWHKTAKNACDPFGNEVYAKYKKWCDEYFFLKHRNEPRGIGGIFFDDLHEWGFSACFDFMQAVGNHYVLAYQPILNKRKVHAYTEKERAFQVYRRGRYVEFNLLYDRGTLFGLQSNGRTESILMSLPPLVAWHYNWMPEAGSQEATLYTEFLQPKNWI